eukprot:jgi/Orpsp1_1/1184435/evm.model.c7180000089503.1
MNLNSLYSIENTLNSSNNNSKFDITFNVVENEEDYLISIEYNIKMYDSTIIKAILNSFVEIIKNIKSLESNNIKNIEYIPQEEEIKILKEFNSDVYNEECNKLYHEEFSKIAEKYPEKCAIVFNETKITYKELDEMSNSLAHYLRSQEIGRNDIIPIIYDQSQYYIIGILGISKSGGAFLPIDKNLPNERIQFIIKDANPKLILFRNCEEVIADLKKEKINQFNMYNLDKHNYSLNRCKISNINNPDDICYILFTSGTTGNPKGAIINHFNLYNFVRTYECYYKQNNSSQHCVYDIIMRKGNSINVLGISNFSFDASNVEILFTLVQGLKLIFVSEDIINNVILLSNYINKNEVDMIQITPSRLKLFMEYDEFKNILRQIKLIILCGEELKIEMCEYINKYSNCKIFNGYGPTECTTACCYKMINCNDSKIITIGKPIINYNVYILDKYKKPVPVGVEGEIYIGGYGVGKGYLNRPELTKEKFIDNPFNYENDEHNRIMYRTGDLGKWTSEGEIEYLGRIDFQVKINGQRVELREIENKVLEIPEIQQCVVIDKNKESGEKYLICYYITSKEDQNTISNKNIGEYLREKLP